jgi:hypothetical protein
VRSSQFFNRKPGATSARVQGHGAAQPEAHSVDEQNPWRDSSMELVQGLDVIEAAFDTLPGEVQGAFGE